LATTALAAAASAADANALLTSLRSPVASERIEAGRALRAATNLPETAAAALVEAMNDAYFDVRAGAADALFRMGATAVPHLGRALSSTNYHHRCGAARTLGRIGPAAAPALPDLGKALSDEAMDVRCEAAQAILNIGHADKVVKDLLKALRDGTVSSLAAQALATAGKAAVHDLVAILQGSDRDAADAAARAVEAIGPDAAEATPALIVMFRRDMDALRTEVTKVDGPDMRRRLVVSFMSGRPAHGALVKMGAAAAPHLLDMLKSRDTLAMQCACDVIAKMGKENAPAVPELIRILRESADFGERDASVWALAAAAADSPEAIAAFRDNLCGKNPPLLHASAHCLFRLKAARALAEVVKQGTPEGRGLARRFLTDMAGNAQDAVPVLREAARDGDADVKSAAEAILKAIEGK
jgi:HEAT repeat protein